MQRHLRKAHVLLTILVLIPKSVNQIKIINILGRWYIMAMCNCKQKILRRKYWRSWFPACALTVALMYTSKTVEQSSARYSSSEGDLFAYQDIRLAMQHPHPLQLGRVCQEMFQLLSPLLEVLATRTHIMSVPGDFSIADITSVRYCWLWWYSICFLLRTKPVLRLDVVCICAKDFSFSSMTLQKRWWRTAVHLPNVKQA